MSGLGLRRHIDDRRRFFPRAFLEEHCPGCTHKPHVGRCTELALFTKKPCECPGL